MDSGYQLRINDTTWTLPGPQQVVDIAPARVFRRLNAVANSDNPMDQLDAMFDLFSVVAPADAIAALENLPISKVTEVFNEWMDSSDDGDDDTAGVTVGESVRSTA